MKPQVEVALSVLAYSLCSGTLVLLNKLILHNLPYPSLVVTLQIIATLIFIGGAKFYGKLEVDDLVWKHVVPYLYYVAAFSLGVFCNMKSLSLSNVETVVVFRALSPCLVAVLDFMFLGREYPSMRSWCALALIVIGAYGYAAFDTQFQTQGCWAYFWPTLYLFIICFEMAYGKKIIQSVDLKTHSGPVLYTNLLSVPPMLLFAAMGHEYQHFHKDVMVSGEHTITLGVAVLVLMGCVTGTGIGYASWWCRDQVSATSFTLIGVINKCLTILLNCLVWDQHAPPAGIACLFLCLVGGTLYQQSPLRKDYQEEQLQLQRQQEVNDDEEEPEQHPTPSLNDRNASHDGHEHGDDDEEAVHLLSIASSSTTAPTEKNTEASKAFKRSISTISTKGTEVRSGDI